MMMVILFIALYVVQLMIVYYALRQIHINEPRLVSSVDTFCILPIFGFLFLFATYIDYLCRNKTKKQILDKIFMIKK